MPSECGGDDRSRPMCSAKPRLAALARAVARAAPLRQDAAHVRVCAVVHEAVVLAQPVAEERGLGGGRVHHAVRLVDPPPFSILHLAFHHQQRQVADLQAGRAAGHRSSQCRRRANPLNAHDAPLSISRRKREGGEHRVKVLIRPEGGICCGLELLRCDAQRREVGGRPNDDTLRRRRVRDHTREHSGTYIAVLGRGSMQLSKKLGTTVYHKDSRRDRHGRRLLHCRREHGRRW